MQSVNPIISQVNILNYPEDTKYSAYHILGAPLTQLRIAGHAYGAMAFAPCLPKDDPRFCFGADNAFLFFQPYSSFARRGLGEPIAWAPDGVTSKVRKFFEDKGRGYQSFETNRDALWKLGALLPDWSLRARERV